MCVCGGGGPRARACVCVCVSSCVCIAACVGVNSSTNGIYYSFFLPNTQLTTISCQKLCARLRSCTSTTNTSTSTTSTTTTTTNNNKNSARQVLSIYANFECLPTGIRQRNFINFAKATRVTASIGLRFELHTDHFSDWYLE